MFIANEAKRDVKELLRMRTYEYMGIEGDSTSSRKKLGQLPLYTKQHSSFANHIKRSTIKFISLVSTEETQQSSDFGDDSSSLMCCRINAFSPYASSDDSV
jgi:hypothetical protein